jgi:hypothetical protein
MCRSSAIEPIPSEKKYGKEALKEGKESGTNETPHTNGLEVVNYGFASQARFIRISHH